VGTGQGGPYSNHGGLGRRPHISPKYMCGRPQAINGVTDMPNPKVIEMLRKLELLAYRRGGK